MRAFIALVGLVGPFPSFHGQASHQPKDLPNYSQPWSNTMKVPPSKQCSIQYIICVFFISMAMKQQCNVLAAGADRDFISDSIIELYDTGSDLLSPLYTFKAASAIYGPRLPFGKEAADPKSFSMPIQVHNNTLCNSDLTPETDESNFIALVPMGLCSPGTKIKNAQKLGAKHVIIYNTLEYLETTTDYFECKNGDATIPDHEHRPDPPSMILCEMYSSHGFADVCPSNLCIWTDTKIGQHHQACCAWDLYMNIYDGSEDEELTISSTFLTIKEKDKLLEILNDTNGDGSMRAVVYERWYPKINISSLLICILGVGVMWLSSFMSAKQYRNVRNILETTDLDLSEQEPPLRDIPASLNEDHHHRLFNVIAELEQELQPGERENVHSSSTNEYAPTSAAEETNDQEPNSDTTPTPLRRHQRNRDLSQASRLMVFQILRVRRSVTIFAMAVTLMLVIFFPRFEDVMKILFAVVGSISTVSFLIYPILYTVSDRVVGMSILTRPICSNTSTASNGLMWLDLLSIMGGFGIGLIWTWNAFTEDNFRYNSYCWVLQNVMSTSFFVVCLGLLQVKSIRIPVVLLSIISMYLFLILFSTLFLGISNVWTVEKSQSDVDPYFCQKYPNGMSCSPTPLPFLLVIPKMYDYRGGMSTLSFADILLPGLLCSFAARYDTTKHVMRSLNTRQRAARRGMQDISPLVPHKNNVCRRLFSGYFYRLVTAYAAGMVVYLVAGHHFIYGRQVLMFVSPLLLLTLYAQAYKRGDLQSFWHGPRRIVVADQLVYRVYNEGAGRIGIGANGLDEYSTAGTRSIISSSESEMDICEDINDQNLTRN